MDNPKILVLVLSADGGGYDKMVKSIKETWASTRLPNVEVLYYYGYRNNHPRPEKDKVIRVGDDLICGHQESIHDIGYKTILAFDYVLKNHSFDYLLRCCAGSYYEQTLLTEHLKNKPREKFYNGAKGNLNGIVYASGAGCTLSRDVVELVVKNASKWDHNLIDDAALGKLLGNEGIKVDIDTKRYWIGDRVDFREMAKREPTKGYFHFHIGNRPEVMYHIHQHVIAQK